MSALWPAVLWYGGLLGMGLAALLVLWALALYIIKHATGVFVSVILAAALALTATSTWAVTSGTNLSLGGQLLKIHGPLLRRRRT